MQKVAVLSALSLLVMLLGFTAVGCDATRTFGPSPNPNPTPNPAPTPQPAQAPMGAFIEDIGIVAFSTNHRNMYVATNDGTGLTKVNAQLRDFNSVYVLPDGSKAVFAAHAADGYSQIYYLAPADSATAPIQLTSTPVNKASAMISADGSKIVFLQFNPFQQDPDGLPVGEVGVMDVNGKNLYVIPRPQGLYVSHPFFSPDGKTIAVALRKGGFGGDMGVFIMHADGSGLTRLTPGGSNGILAVAPAFSPDGQQVVFSSVGWEDLSIYRINRDGTGLQLIGQPNSGGGDPLFVGEWVMFIAKGEIYTMKADGTDLTRVTNDSYQDAFEMSID